MTVTPKAESVSEGTGASRVQRCERVAVCGRHQVSDAANHSALLCRQAGGACSGPRLCDLPLNPRLASRAERFATDYVDPGRVRKDYHIMMEARRERQKQEGFATGIDVFSQVSNTRAVRDVSIVGLWQPQTT